MERKETFTIGLVQESCTEDIARNVENAIAGVKQAAKQGAQIICLQELFNSTYFCTTENEQRFELAEPIPGPTVTRMQTLAKELKTVIIVPIFERRAAGLYHNSAAIIDADGALLGVYRKMHIPDDPLYLEKYYFTPGDASDEAKGFKVFRTRYADIGVLICWDQWYPEAARLTSLLGAEVIFYPTAIGWHPREKESYGAKQLNAWRTIQISHAVANGVFVASVNRVGHEETPGTDGLEFFGHSFIADPFGEIISENKAPKPAVLIAECRRRAIEETRRAWPFLRDRRVDAYPGITRRYLDGVRQDNLR